MWTCSTGVLMHAHKISIISKGKQVRMRSQWYVLRIGSNTEDLRNLPFDNGQLVEANLGIIFSLNSIDEQIELSNLGRYHMRFKRHWTGCQ